jgi:hypothetical protein
MVYIPVEGKYILKFKFAGKNLPGISQGRLDI